MKHRYNPALIFVGIVLFFVFASADTPPVASFEVYATADGSLTTVLLDASSSHDPDGTIATYQWLYGDGYSGSGVTKTHAFASVSTYTITLWITDDSGQSTMTSQTIDLTQPLPQQPQPGAGAEDPVPGVAIPYDIPVGIRVGERAPAFALPNQEDEIVELASFLGHVVLIEFWSSSCGGCEASMPHLEELREQFAELGLIVIAITTSRYPDREWPYLIERGYTQFVMLRESDPIEKPTMNEYDVSRIPHAFLLDQRGVIVFTGHINDLQADMIEPLL